MFNFVKSHLIKLNIDLVSCLHLDECEIIRPYLLQNRGIHNGSVIIFAVPYFTNEEDEKRNISSYAVSRDYHLFFKSLFEELIVDLEKEYPENKFVGFTDHSPINEIKAAAKAGLGVIGENHLLLTNKYSSFVFIGEIITDAILNSNAQKIEYCNKCGKCRTACPVGMDITSCLSSLTQKKGELDENETALIKKHGCVWGCDICQFSCPYTQNAIKDGTIYTNIDFFKESRTPFLNCESISQMSEDEFSSRAYSWRGKKTIIRNLKITEGKDE